MPPKNTISPHYYSATHTMPPVLKLSYFPIQGQGEKVRLAFTLGKIAVRDAAQDPSSSPSLPHCDQPTVTSISISLHRPPTHAAPASRCSHRHPAGCGHRV